MRNEKIVPNGNKMNSTSLHRWMVMLLTVMFALPAMAGWLTKGQDDNAMTSANAFQSTSTMQGSGSSHSSTPASLNDEGQATYSAPAVNAPANAPSGPRKSFGENSDGGTTSDPNSPVGDAMLPLMLMAAAFGGGIYLRRRKAAQA